MQTLELTRTDSNEDAEVRRASVDLANKLRMRSVLSIPPAVAVIVALQWRGTTPTRVAIWLALVLPAITAYAVPGWLYSRARRRGQDGDRYIWALDVGACVWGLAWGASAPFLFGPSSRPDLELTVIVFLCATSAINLVLNGGVRRTFLLYQIPMALIPALTLLIRGGSQDLLLAAATLVFLGLIIAMHQEVHRSVTGAIRLEIHTRHLIEDLAHQSAHDELTGLPNRISFAASVSDALDQPDSNTVAVIFVDLDRFTVVNDALGHALGDELVQAAAVRLRESLGPSVTLARTGGDEFSLLLVTADKALPSQVAQTALRSFADRFVLHGRELRVTASVGLAVSDRRSDSAADLLRHADAALHQAKRNGRARVAVFDDDARSALLRQVDDEVDLRRALEAGEIVPWFQPVVELATGEILGAEALARWIHPERGVIPPGLFIPLAEECGMIGELGRTIFESTVGLRRTLTDLGVRPDLALRVNVSAHQLVDGADRAFVRFVEASGIDPIGLSLEVTESAVATDPTMAIEVLNRLREAGHRVSLDDFGTGFSSLSLLRGLPLDGIKIDRSFIQHVEQNASDRTMCQLIIDMAAKLGLGVTAEGIETEEQATLLRGFGCTEAQGYLWSPAVSGDEFARWLLSGSPWAGSKVST